LRYWLPAERCALTRTGIPVQQACLTCRFEGLRGKGNTRSTPDKARAKLAALQFYQLSIPAPGAPAESYDKAAFERGKTVFNGPAKCATRDVPPLYTEAGNNLHAPSAIGIDAFQADRSPTHMYRTSPIAELWIDQKGGFFHDGRFTTCSTW